MGKVDKKLLMLQAMKYLKIDFLYGLVSGMFVRDYLMTSADKIVQDGMDPAEISRMVEEMVINDPTFMYAHRLGTMPLPPVLDVSAEEKKQFVEDYIKSLPYAGDIRISQDSTINIREKLLSKVKSMNDDLEIIVGFDVPNRTIKDEYRILLDNEYIPQNRLDKIDVIMDTIRRLREKYPNFDEIAEFKYNGRSFLEDVKDLPARMDDKFELIDRFEVSALDYMVTRFESYEKAYKDDIRARNEAMFNSTNSRPSEVETINITTAVTEDGKTIKVPKNTYVFLSDDEVESINSNEPQNTNEEFFVGQLNLIIDAANNVDSQGAIEALDDDLSTVRGEIRELGIVDPMINNQLALAADEIDKATKRVEMKNSVNEDMSYEYTEKIMGMDAELSEIEKEFNRSLVYPAKLFDELNQRYESIKQEAEEWDLNISRVLGEFESKLKRFKDTAINTIRQQEDNKKRLIKDADLIMNQINSIRRVYDYMTVGEKGGSEIRLESLSQQLIKLLNTGIEQRIINQDEAYEYVEEVRRGLVAIGIDIYDDSKYDFRLASVNENDMNNTEYSPRRY